MSGLKSNSLDLISFLNLVKNNNFPEIESISQKYPEILHILSVLDVITVLSSDSDLKIELTNLGLSIITNFNLENSLANQESFLQGISSDLKRIKSSLSALSLDIIRNQGIQESLSSNSDYLLQKDLNKSEIPKGKSPVSSIFSKSQNQNKEQVKEYIYEISSNLTPELIESFSKHMNNIKKLYAKVSELLHTGAYEEFGFESFLLVDAIMIYILKFFNQRNPQVLSLSLTDKSKILKDFPLDIDTELLEFLDKYNTDLQNNSSDRLKIGEKTSTKLFGLINNTYKTFISLFTS